MIGPNLSNHPYLDYLESETAQGLKDKLDQIKMPFLIISIYHANKKHVAWVSLTRKIKKVKQEK